MLYSQQQQKIMVQDRDNEVKNRDASTVINCCFDIHHDKSIHNGTESLQPVPLSLKNRLETKVLKPTDFPSMKIN